MSAADVAQGSEEVDYEADSSRWNEFSAGDDEPMATAQNAGSAGERRRLAGASESDSDEERRRGDRFETERVTEDAEPVSQPNGATIESQPAARGDFRGRGRGRARGFVPRGGRGTRFPPQTGMPIFPGMPPVRPPIPGPGMPPGMPPFPFPPGKMPPQIPPGMVPPLIPPMVPGRGAPTTVHINPKFQKQPGFPLSMLLPGNPGYFPPGVRPADGQLAPGFPGVPPPSAPALGLAAAPGNGSGGGRRSQSPRRSRSRSRSPMRRSPSPRRSASPRRDSRERRPSRRSSRERSRERRPDRRRDGSRERRREPSRERERGRDRGRERDRERERDPRRERDDRRRDDRRSRSRSPHVATRTVDRDSIQSEGRSESPRRVVVRAPVADVKHVTTKSQTVLVSGLAAATTTPDLRAFMESPGGLIDVSLGDDGTATATYQDEPAATRARRQLNKGVLLGSRVSINLA